MGNWLLLIGSALSFATSTAFLVEADRSSFRQRYGETLIWSLLCILLTVVAVVLFSHANVKEMLPDVPSVVCFPN